ncbi:MAG TPA: hypothetical protein VNO30_06430, partial [Kofleriaceae bacterium]|nr:hypothetical protein [Kofleriaceae bacterium]
MTHLELFGRVLGEFLVRERIGVGGHGIVYRCEQRELGRDVVVKVLLAKPGDWPGRSASCARRGWPRSSTTRSPRTCMG